MADEYKPEIAVASIDILGLKNMLGMNDRSLSAMNAIGVLVRNAYENRMYEDLNDRSKFTLSHDVSMHFGDSVYLIGDPSKNIQEQVVFLASRCAALVTFGLANRGQNFLARVGVAVGDLRTRVVQTTPGPVVLRIGSAMSNAHAVEDKQDWIGGAIDVDFELPEEGSHYFRYAVPMKSGSNRSPGYAINWLWETEGESIADRLDQVSSSVGSSDDVESKIRNSKALIEYAKARNYYRSKMKWNDR